jgi:type II secretory ATPase GspE/PulE/Tfp pilus assembly ATPase PilB-like protein
MFIASGPTGAGKSTTLYAMISEIDAYQKNIITIEDPIEYRLDNVTQTPINPKAGVTFASSLRSSLRQDPDVIMVGEIRDAETARVACQAAMTGHFVFTTLHANDSVTSLFRLLDLGVEPYFIASSLSAVLAQRLCRVLCPTCKEAYVPEPEFFKSIGLPPGKEIQLYKSVGCEECQGTGYRGRIGIFELLEVTDAIKELLRTTPGVQAITAEAKKTGFRKLHEDGLAKVIKGLTSVKELLRVTR